MRQRCSLTWIALSAAVFIAASIQSCGDGAPIASPDNSRILPDTFSLQIPDEGFEQFKAKREAALEKGVLIKSKSDYITGIFHTPSDTFPVKARLKGDHTDHLQGNQWSLRIKAIGDARILGQKKISVQAPETRSHLHEWIFHRLLQREGLISLPYSFNYFCLNDTLCGIYAFEGHFDSAILTESHRPFGPIAKLDESAVFSRTQKKYLQDSMKMRNAEAELINDFEFKTALDQQQGQKLIQLLNLYRQMVYPPDSIMDLDAWAKFLAINEVMNCDHGTRWHNLRFYLNPETNLVEPVGFDCESWFLADKPILALSESIEAFYTPLVKNAGFMELYLHHLKRLSDHNYMTQFFAENKEELETWEKVIQLFEPHFRFSEVYYTRSLNRIQAQLSTMSAG